MSLVIILAAMFVCFEIGNGCKEIAKAIEKAASK